MRMRVDEAELEAELVERLKKFARRRRRRGYRLAHWELRRDGFAVNHKRVYRLWKGAGLNVPPRKSRKRIRGTGAPRPAVTCHDLSRHGNLTGSGALTFWRRRRLRVQSCGFCA